jgi:glutathione S-transferase
MKLYYAPGACSLASHIVAREAGIDLELAKVNVGKDRVEGGGRFSEVNGKGCVPALALDDGQTLTEGPAILQYLADLRPASGLAPQAGTMERYRLQEWLNYTTSELHKSFGPLFADTPEAVREWARGRITEQFDWLAPQLAGRRFLLGEAFTAADAYLFVVVGWAKWVDIDLAKWPPIAEYVARVAARPAVQAALKAEGLE